jgi:hypothetical protein
MKKGMQSGEKAIGLRLGGSEARGGQIQNLKYHFSGILRMVLIQKVG